MLVLQLVPVGLADKHTVAVFTVLLSHTVLLAWSLCTEGSVCTVLPMQAVLLAWSLCTDATVSGGWTGRQALCC